MLLVTVRARQFENASKLTRIRGYQFKNRSKNQLLFRPLMWLTGFEEVKSTVILVGGVHRLGKFLVEN